MTAISNALRILAGNIELLEKKQLPKLFAKQTFMWMGEYYSDIGKKIINDLKDVMEAEEKLTPPSPSTINKPFTFSHVHAALNGPDGLTSRQVLDILTIIDTNILLDIVTSEIIRLNIRSKSDETLLVKLNRLPEDPISYVSKAYSSIPLSQHQFEYVAKLLTLSQASLINKLISV